MEYITLRNGIKMPLVGLGTWDLNGQECVQSVSEALKLGYRLVDTAHMYGNEKEVGEGIRQSGIARSELFITTKMDRRSNSYDKAKKAIEDSLLNLGVDYIDLYLLHEPYREGPEMYRALEEAYEKGIVRAIGISNYNEQWYQGFLKQCKIKPMVNQLETHVFFQKENFQNILNQNGCALQAWSPLAQQKMNVAGNPILSAIGSKYNKTAAQVALKFLVQRGVGVIPKSRHISRLKENMDLFDFTLSDEDMDQIRTLDRNKTLFPWTEAF